MSTLANNLIYVNGGFANGETRKAVHPRARQVFLSFEAECRKQGLELQFYSGFRDTEKQRALYNAWLKDKTRPKAAPPGTSNHELGLAMDTYVWDPEAGAFNRNAILLKKVASIAYNFGLNWGGNFSVGNEQHHFEILFGVSRSELHKRKKDGNVDALGYVIIDGEQINNFIKSYDFKVKTDLGSESQEVEEIKTENKRFDPPKTITNVEDRPAVGIWQIIKFMADRYSLGQSINDATIAFNQGSLINFIQKVVQAPWLQFYGDTWGDQYYFTTRKEPFDYNGFITTPAVSDYITEDLVIGDDLSWYNGPIYSWYQIIPQGSFLGEQNQIFAHVTAVFFEEYAEVWGSKPLSVVSNYINFIKIGDGAIMVEKAMEDLRYMVESNCYLPFTRTGTITVRGNAIYKRGYWVFYQPTREWFYIDGVNHRYVITDGGEEMITTLKVSRGMEYRHMVAPKDNTTKSYWNLILFDDPPPTTNIEKEKVAKLFRLFYFDNDRSYLIDMNETWPPAADTNDKKMFLQIQNYPQLRNTLNARNLEHIDECVQIIENNPDATFKCIGWIDEDFGNKNSVLPLKRAQTVKTRVLDAYMKKHPNDNRENIAAKIFVIDGGTAKFSEEQKGSFGDATEKEYKTKALQRIVEFRKEEHFRDKEVKVPTKGVAWRVNDEVFQYFLKRQQFNRCDDV